MKGLARSYVYWPKMDADIEQYARSYKPCAYHSHNPAKALLHHWEEPTRPGQRVHIDHAQEGKDHFFLIVDAYSKWPEIEMVPCRQQQLRSYRIILHSLSV